MKGKSTDGIIFDGAITYDPECLKLGNTSMGYKALRGFTSPPPIRKLTFIEKYETHIISFTLGFTVAIIANITSMVF